MTLAQAMREGAKLRPQAFYKLFFDGGSCALGAALEAVFGMDSVRCPLFWNEIDETLRSCLPQLPRLSACPECGTEFGTLRTVTHLNDEHRWTRERIADWVETVESQPVEGELELVIA
jgi:hypothetical protein